MDKANLFNNFACQCTTFAISSTVSDIQSYKTNSRLLAIIFKICFNWVLSQTSERNQIFALFDKEINSNYRPISILLSLENIWKTHFYISFWISWGTKITLRTSEQQVNCNFQVQVCGPWSVYYIRYTTSHFNLLKMVLLLSKLIA